MGIENRLRRLEASSGKECAGCGFDGDYGKLVVQINVRGINASEYTPGPDRCPECGRGQVIRVPGFFSTPAAIPRYPGDPGS